MRAERPEVPVVELLPTRDGRELVLRRQFPAHRTVVLEAKRVLEAFRGQVKARIRVVR